MDKLSDFGFEICGFIDAYSRYILRIYVGVSNRTAVSVQKQDLEMVKQYGFLQPIPSDKGTATVLMAEYQLRLRRQQKPDLKFDQAYAYKSSTKNQPIEA